MPKTIKLDDDTYRKLELFRDKRETFSQAVGRLLLSRREIMELCDILEGQLNFREWQREKLEENSLGSVPLPK